MANHLLTPRDWQAEATVRAAKLTGSPEGALALVEAKRYGMLADEIERLRADDAASGLRRVVASLGEALRGLTFAARTSGGTAGPDAGLMAACEKAEHALSLVGIGQAMLGTAHGVGVVDHQTKAAQPPME